MSTTKPQLGRLDQFTLDRAREALEVSRADTDTAAYPRHLGRLEVCVADLIRLVETLAGDQE
jgi:hypothetical protein